MIHRNFKPKILDSRGVDYGLSSHDHTGELRSVPPKILYGNEKEIKTVIKTINSDNKYFSGVISFGEKILDQKIKDRIIKEHKTIMYPGIDPDQVSWLYVEHGDKGFLEIHWWIACINLISGKSLKPYYSRIDAMRFRLWVQTVNDRFGLSDPNDPINWRLVAPPNTNLSSSKKDVKLVGLKSLRTEAEAGKLKSRDDIEKLFESAECEVRQWTDRSVTIRNIPTGESFKFEGRMFDRSWTGVLTQEKKQELSLEFKNNKSSRLLKTIVTLEELFYKRMEYNSRRYKIKISKPCPIFTDIVESSIACAKLDQLRRNQISQRETKMAYDSDIINLQEDLLFK